MKILLLIPSLRNGGAERVAARLYYSLKSRGHDPLIVTFSDGEVDYPVDNHIAMGIESSTNYVKKIINVIRRVYCLKRIKKVFSPHISIGFLFGANLVNAYSRRNEHLVISSVHNTSRFEDEVPFTRLINDSIYSKSDYIVPVSLGIKGELLEKYSLTNDKLKVIYNYIDIHKDIKPRLDFRLNLVTMGRLEKQKAQWHLIHSINDLRQYVPTITLRILGQGSLHSELSNLIKDLGLLENVHLLGFQKDIGRYLTDSDVFVLSSRNEGLPNVILESMNMGLPVISTDIPHGPKEILNPDCVKLYSNDNLIIDNKYGLLVDYGNNQLSNQVGYRDEFIVQQFVNKILLLVNNPDIYRHYSEQSLKRVKDFSEQVVLDQWTDLFKKYEES